MVEIQKHIVVVGAGIVGVSAALWMQRAGHRVTLIDRAGPAAGTSYGNAGILASGSVVPVTVPGLMKKAPWMLLSRDQPLFLRAGHIPKLLPFLRHYLKFGRADRTEKVSKGLADLLLDAPDQHVALAAGTDAAKYIEAGDWLYGYKDKAAFEADRFGWDMRKRRGVSFEALEPEALAAYDPELAGRFGYGVRLDNHGAIRDPGAYVTALADHFVAEGGTLKIAELTDLKIEAGRCAGVITSGGEVTADAYVMTVGVWTGPIAKRLGITVPLESERGYHIEFYNPNLRFRAPLMVASGKFGVNSMHGRLRVAGVVEFGGVDAPASKAPFAFLRRQVEEFFPDLTYDRVEEWMGHRPSTADSLPVIGAAPNAANVFFGYGHQHVGLTAGPKTGRWLSQLVSDQPPNVDLSAYAPDRKI